MQDQDQWSTAAGAALTATLLFVLGFVAGTSWSEFKSFMNGPAASWVGGLGSAAAVVGSVWAVRRQIDHQLENERRSEVRKMSGQLVSLLGMLQYAHAEAVKVVKRAYGPVPVSGSDALIMSIECRRALAQLQQVSPLVFTEAPVLVIALGTTSSAMEVLLAEITGYVQGSHFGYHDEESLRYVASLMEIHIRNAVADAQGVVSFWEKHSKLPQHLQPPGGANAPPV